MIELKEIKISNLGRRVAYVYNVPSHLKKYFNNSQLFVEYDVDISNVPEHILAIPFLANVMPVAWFAHFDVKIMSVDKIFNSSLLELKKEFSKSHPQISEGTSELIFDHILETPSIGTYPKNAMLFSGGLDAYTTFLSHRQENPDLITICGADMKLSDAKQWQELVEYNETTDIIANNSKFYIKSNFRDFLTYEVDKLLLNQGWWGKIQHGMALTTLTAPLSFLNNYKLLYIGSSRSSGMSFSAWGSMPMTDNLIQWNSTQVVHDGYNLSRFNKVEFVVDETANMKLKPPIRACYNEFKTTLNCNKCEKCARTIFGLMLKNVDPNLYGFEVNQSIYQNIIRKLENGFATHGTRLYWEEMIYAYEKNCFFYLQDKESEEEQIHEIIGTYNKVKDKSIGNSSKKYQWKQEIIHKFPNLFNIYLNLRQKLKE